jgi:uncharacterized protein
MTVRPLHAVTAYCLMLVLGLALLLLGEALGGIAAALGRVGGVQIAGLLSLFLVIGLGGLAWRPSLGLYAPRLSFLPAALLVGAGLSLLIASTLSHLYSLGEAEEHARAVDDVLRETTRTLGPVAMALIILLLGPVVEELLFRGLILRGFHSRYPAWAAVLVSTVLFAMLHGHPVHGLITAVLGLACALAVLRAGSIWPAVVLHCAYNANTWVWTILAIRNPCRPG